MGRHYKAAWHRLCIYEVGRTGAISVISLLHLSSSGKRKSYNRVFNVLKALVTNCQGFF